MIAVSNKLDAPPIIQPLQNVRLSQLPAEFQAILNPANPLTVEQFAPQVSSSPLWGIAALPCVPLVGGLIEIARRGGKMPAAELSFALILAVPLLLVVAALLYFARRKSKYKRQVETGELRLGLFIHRDALLVRTAGVNSCSLLPRGFLRGVIMAKYAHARYVSATKMTFIDAVGNHYSNIVGINSFGFVDKFDHFQNLADALRRWKPELEIVENL